MVNDHQRRAGEREERMLDAASKKRQRPNADTSSAATATDGSRQDERDRSRSSGAGIQPSESRMNRIAHRAHEIYEAREGEHGKALEDWLQAEREIDSEL
jgi:hypothetical protein